jgi:hypothetical protein
LRASSRDDLRELFTAESSIEILEPPVIFEEDIILDPFDDFTSLMLELWIFKL